MATAVLRLGLEAAALGRALAGTSRVRLPRAVAPGVQWSRGLASSAAAKELQKTVRPRSPSSSSSSSSSSCWR